MERIGSMSQRLRILTVVMANMCLLVRKRRLMRTVEYFLVGEVVFMSNRMVETDWMARIKRAKFMLREFTIVAISLVAQFV